LPGAWQTVAVPYHKMSSQEVRELLSSSPSHTAKLATVRADGRPHVAPVWYDVDDDGAIVFNTWVSSVKGRNLARTGRAALCVDDEQPPFAYVVIEGPVELIDDVGVAREWAERIAARYMGADRAQEFGLRNGVAGELVVRLRPDRVTASADLAE